ncbi:hypothetical protein TUM20983_36870 [Mycobacterium antarcticum]|nr:hypothetical protein TUM20983_36870 [Mycolicibacterium sp. TUM20983]
MKLRRARQDLDHINSWILLTVTAATIVTGLIAHLWDLHGFVWHIYFGYAMIASVVVHVCLNMQQLLVYSSFRFRRGARAMTGKPRPRPGEPQPVGAGSMARALLLSRRGLIGVAVGGVGGYLLGQGVVRASPSLARGEDLGLVYHQWSSDPGLVDAVGALANWGRQPSLYKNYDGAPRVFLPEPLFDGGLSTEATITRRHSSRAYAQRSMTAQELARVLWLSSGLLPDGRRTHPSSGALYPIETYVVVHNVEGVEPGVYHYGIEHHELRLLRAGDYREYVVAHGLNQDFLGSCAAVVYLSLIFQRMRFKYGERGYRYGVIEAGHIGQNIYLAATSIGLGACAVGAYDDRGINDLLGIDGVEEISVYLLSLGNV